MPLAAYDGETRGIAIAVHEFNNAYRSFVSPNTRPQIRIKVVDHLEARLYSIIRGLNTNESHNDKRWFIANRREIADMVETFSNIRRQLNRYRDNDTIDEMTSTYERLREKLTRDLLSPEENHRYGKLVAACLAMLAVGTGVVVTGASAASFTAGPIVGGAVTGGVAVASVATTAVAAGVGYKIGYHPSTIPLEDMIRAPYEYRRPAP